MKIRFVSSLFVLLTICLKANADSGTWLPNPANNEWNNPANWSSGTVPGSADVATFAQSTETSLTDSGVPILSGIAFAPGASSYTTTLAGENQNGLTCRGNVTNDSGVAQNFVVEPGTSFNLFNFPNEPAPTVDERVTFTMQAGGGVFLFEGTANGGAGTFINEGGSSAGQSGGFLEVIGIATAGEGTIVNRGATAAGAEGGRTTFVQQFPSAKNATLVAEAGSNGGQGGTIAFYDASTGGTSRAEVFGNGYLDISPRSGAGGASMTIGSLEGDGQVYLGRQTLIVGSNNLDTTFAGVLHPGGPAGGSGGGAFSKIGTGMLTLSGPNLYTAGTTVSAGTLVVSNTIGSGTGPGAVSVNAGTLGGKGTVAGAVTLGMGSGAGAFLAPAHGTKQQASLTSLSGLTFKADSTYTCTFKAKG
nr:autotransporter-associated beta strand repeat-containing protein [Chthoniobacterales bacterium]